MKTLVGLYYFRHKIPSFLTRLEVFKITY